MDIANWIALGMLIITLGAMIAAIVSAKAASSSAKSSSENAETAKKELELAKEEAEKMRKSDSLKIVLDIENQMNARKSEFENASKEFGELMPNKGGKERFDLLESWVDSKKESYYNIIDRLCFCYLKGFVEEKEWRPEYRNLIHNTIKSDPDAFGVDSPYTNIIKLNKKWQSE